MRRCWVILFLMQLLVGAGCRSLHPQLPQPLAMKLPDAYQVPAGQLVFHSDFALPADHRLVRELTAEREDVCRTLGLSSSNEPIQVYLFGDADGYQEFLRRKFPSVPSRRAFFLETDTRLAVYAHWSDRVAEDLRHEVAHGYMHSVVPKMPLWLDEGFAEYFEVGRGLNGLNRPHVDLLNDMAEHENWRPNLARLEKLSEAAQMDQRDYAESWAWVYFFLNSPPERREVLMRYVADLQSRGTGDAMSVRLAKLNADPGQPMAKYLATLKSGTVAR
jgi:hypothetical protein